MYKNSKHTVLFPLLLAAGVVLGLVLGQYLGRNTTTSLPDRVRRIVAQYQEKGLESEIDTIPCTEFFAPDSIDFTNGRHICIDGLYYAYLLVPSTGYKAQVPAGLSLIHI